MRRRSTAAAVYVLALGGLLADAHAADHFDGNTTAASPSSDIADVFAFPAPSRRGIVLVLNTFPRAGTSASFSDAVAYGFRVRPAELERTEWGVATVVDAREIHFVCTFALSDGEDPALPMVASCRLMDDGALVAETQVAVDAEDGGPSSTFRVFAGLRADPFFTDAIRVRLARPRYSSLTLLVSTGNSMRPARTAVGVNLGGPRQTRGDVPNVLSIIVELDLGALIPDLGPRLAVVGETRRRDGGER